MKRSIFLIAALATVASASGCASTSNQTKGAVIGATSGGRRRRNDRKRDRLDCHGARPRRVGRRGGLARSSGTRWISRRRRSQHNVPGASVARVGEGHGGDVRLRTAVRCQLRRADASTARENLTTLAQSLQKYPNTNLLIVGHTDATGTEANNMALSERRAAAAENYLATQGVAPARMRSAGRGATEPVAANDTEADRQQNRRVEVAIYANDAFKAQAKNQ